jgi:hypothetical protein
LKGTHEIATGFARATTFHALGSEVPRSRAAGHLIL